MLEITPTNTDVLILELSLFQDDRGYFLEAYNKREVSETLGIHLEFVQDNFSHSKKGVLRGLHYQLPNAQGKLIRVISGSVFDVSVDLKESSPTFGKWTGLHLSEDEPRIVWIPPGFAHGFLVLSDTADLMYKTTAYYDPSAEHCLKWDDPFVGIEWPIKMAPILSKKDRKGKFINDLPLFP